MELLELQKLRKKQVISLNFFIITFIFTIGTIIYLLEPSRFIVLLLFIIFMLISCVFTWLDIVGKEWRKSEWARKLVAYEKGKLGREWFKLKRSELTTKLFLILLFVLQLFIGNASERFLPTFIGIPYWLLFIIAVILITNISLYFRNRKIDHLSSEELQGFTKREIGREWCWV